MTHASVFSGIGGPEVAAEMLGWENLFHCEINPFGRAVLQYWFPNAKSYEDITKTDFSEWEGKVNVLTGGFPCQPFSYAGQRRGADDDRYLWPYMHKCIDQIRPDWVVCENVAGILTMVEQGDVTEMATEKSLFDEGDTLYRYRLEETFTLERICNDLESDGYAVQAVVIPACAVNAPHRRDRVFIIGCRNDITDPSDTGLQETRPEQQAAGDRGFGLRNGCDAADTTSKDGNRGSAQVRQERETITNNKEHTIFPSTERFGGEWATPNTDSNGQCSCGRPSGRKRKKMDKRGEGKPFNGIERFGSPQPTPYPDCNRRREMDERLQPRLADGAKPVGNGRERDAADTSSERPQTGHRGRETGETSRDPSGWYARSNCDIAGCGRWDEFPTVSPVHRGNDGLPFSLDDLTIPASKWRTESLKAYGNAIVPQVMYEIFRAIESTYQ